MAKLKLTAGESNCELEIGTELTTQGAHLNCYAGGDDFNQVSSVYEADKGFIILQAMPQITSQWGESGYTTSLTARDSNFEKVEKIFQSFESLFSKASDDGQDKNSLTVNWIRKQILDYYFKQSSTNARFEVVATAKSHTIRTPEVWPFGPGAVIDTKTANLEMNFSFRVLKLITPEELSLVEMFLNAAIDSNELIKFQYV